MVEGREGRRVIEDTKQEQKSDGLSPFEHMAQSSGDMLALLDGDYVYLAANTAYLEAFGRTAGDVIGKSAESLFGTEVFNAIVRPNGELCLAGERVRYQHWVEFPALGRRFMDVAYSPYTGGVGFVVTARDLTERKRLEDALRKSEALFAVTSRVAKVGGWELDAETLESRWTEETYRIHELPVGDPPALGEGIKFYHPDYRGRLEAAVTRALEFGEPYDIECRFITAKGNRRWTRSVCSPVVVAGKTVRLTGTFQDITECKRAAEKALLLARGRVPLEVAFEQAGDAIFITDSEAAIQYVNPAFERITGYTSVEVVGRKTSLLSSGQHGGSFYAGLWGTISSGRTWNGRIVNKQKNGTLFTADATISPHAQRGERRNHWLRRRRARRDPRTLARSSNSPGAEAGGRRAAGRGRRPRLQQPAHDHSWVRVSDRAGLDG
jgi:PAS domain S-box-containing protein